jgi:hypothetical protein
MTRRLALAGLACLLVWGIWKLAHRAQGPQKPASEESPLYTGKEPKLKVRLCFPDLEKPGFTQENGEIYLTASKGAQIKQLLQQLFRGPLQPGAGAAFPEGFKYREVFATDQGLAVVDLDPDSVRALPGGTSSEFVSLYCLVRTLLDNFKDIKKVQVLVGGQIQESLAGHISISDPLSMEDF